jgi:hypothetical protein
MLISIHQPNFAPWLGFFYKWAQSDAFIILDDVPYSKNSFTNRNQIKFPDGKKWITIPIFYKGQSNQFINTVEINNNTNWKRKIIGSLESNYSKANYFPIFFPEICEIINHDWINLIDINMKIINWIIEKIKIEIPYSFSSQLNGIKGESTERIVSICERFGANKYLSGSGGDKYHDISLFKKKNIIIKNINFKYNYYPQQWEGFIPNLSIIDVLMNCGPDKTKQLLKI